MEYIPGTAGNQLEILMNLISKNVRWKNQRLSSFCVPQAQGIFEILSSQRVMKIVHALLSK